MKEDFDEKNKQAREKLVADLPQKDKKLKQLLQSGDKKFDLHGVLECKHCGVVWDRDVNASKNMAIKGLLRITGRELPGVWK